MYFDREEKTCRQQPDTYILKGISCLCTITNYNKISVIQYLSGTKLIYSEILGDTTQILGW